MDAAAAEPGLLPGPVVVRRTGPADPAAGSPVAAPESWDCHLHRWGPRSRGGLWLVDAAAAGGLNGCGGGFFPAARKWRAALRGAGPVRLVANAAESESLSAKDATLLRLCPHLLLDGLAVLAETLDASDAVVWMHDGDPSTRRAVEDALAERRRVGLDEVPVQLVAVPGSYLAGESSAIKHALAGGPVVPQFHGFGTPPGGGPTTLVHNVETLARLGVLCRDSAAAGVPFARDPASPVTRLLTVLTPHDRRVVEVPDEARLEEAVRLATGSVPSASAAVLLAGFGGVWARWGAVAGNTLDESGLRRLRLTLGAGIVAPLWERACGVAITAAITAYLARETAGQCGPCLFGLPALAESLARLRDGTGRRHELHSLERDLSAVAGRGACHHPDGAVRMVRTALAVFEDDVAAHAAGEPCGLPGDGIPVPEG